MNLATANLPAPAYPVFADIDPEVLATAEPEPHTAKQMLTGAWSDYLRRMLPAVQAAEAAA
ncbi:MAG: hypothetical protein NT133_17445 [Alphaproteobacteria bacterium]|nr:hypothetical protein [Alphaproteobacteria bacterium]